MGEIKSTLDLVMERTRNLRFTDDEKKDLQIEDLKKLFNGMVQKYLDGLLDIEAIRREVTLMRKDHAGLDLDPALRQVILERTDLQALGGPLPDLLQELFGVDTAILRRLGHTYREQETLRSAEVTESLKQQLHHQAGISGSAVIPNLEAAPQWRTTAQALQDEFTDRLSAEIKALQ